MPVDITNWSRLRFLAAILAVVFGVEAVVMIGLPYLIPLHIHHGLEAVVDATLLTLLSAPILWLVLLRPLRRSALAARARHAVIVHAAPDGILTVDERGTVTEFNAAAERIFGYTAAEMIGVSVNRLIPPKQAAEHGAHIARYLRCEASQAMNTARMSEGQRKDGSVFPVELSIAEVRIDGWRMFTVIVRDVTERFRAQRDLREAERELREKNARLQELADRLAQLNEELARASRVDPLTRILNRGAWEESARLEDERSRRNDSAYSVILLDVDHFKKYNDACGHPAGDACLRRLAACFSATCRSIDLVGRYGGEEFAILLPDAAAPGAVELAERIRTSVWELNVAHPSSPTADRITVSLGVCQRDTGTLEQTLERADQALYMAKRAGRNRTHPAEPPALSLPAHAAAADRGTS